MARFATSTHGSTDFGSWPTSGPPNAPTGGNKRGYGWDATPGRPETWLGGVFYATDRPSDTISMTSIQYGNQLDDEWNSQSGYYVFSSSSVPDTRGAVAHFRDPDYDGGNNSGNTIGPKYHLRGTSEGFPGAPFTTGWLSAPLQTDFYFATPSYQIDGAWYWTDTR